jgi:hypothetical protein
MHAKVEKLTPTPSLSVDLEMVERPATMLACFVAVADPGLKIQEAFLPWSSEHELNVQDWTNIGREGAQKLDQRLEVAVDYVRFNPLSGSEVLLLPDWQELVTDLVANEC